MRTRFYAWWPIGLALLGMLSLPFLNLRPNPELTSPTNSLLSVARIPFELNGNHIFFQGRINDSPALWLSHTIVG